MTNTNPLSHHEILGLVAPFTRRGRAVDLGASDRLARRLRFRPIEHGEDPATGLRLTEVLELEAAGGDDFRLTRILTPAGGPEARLRADGADPGALLGRIEAIPFARQFERGPGYLLAYGHRIAPGGDALILSTAIIECDLLRVEFIANTGSGALADVDLIARGGHPLKLPQDLLAVLGWQWTRLTEKKQGWSARLRTRGGEPGRSARSERRLLAAARHLARTFSEPPARFHARQPLARWAVFARRSVPLVSCFGVIAAAAAVPKLHLAEDSGLRAVIFNAPPILMMLFFCLHEMPTIEIPPIPRPPAPDAWGARWDGAADPVAAR